MLTFIPDSILLGFVNTILYAGIVAIVLGFVFNFRFLAQYRLIVQVVGILLLAAGLYFKGGYEVEQQWRERVKEMEAKVAIAEAKSKEVNTVIQEKVVEKIKVRKETTTKTITVFKETAGKQLDQECKFNKETIDTLNAAAANKPLVLTIPLDLNK